MDREGGGGGGHASGELKALSLHTLMRFKKKHTHARWSEAKTPENKRDLPQHVICEYICKDAIF